MQGLLAIRLKLNDKTQALDLIHQQLALDCNFGHFIETSFAKYLQRKY